MLTVVKDPVLLPNKIKHYSELNFSWIQMGKGGVYLNRDDV